MDQDTVKELMKGIFDSSSLSDIKEIVTMDFVSTSNRNGWAESGILNMVDNIFVVIGLLLVLIYFMTDIIDHLQIQQASFEYFLKSFIKLLIGIFIVSNCVQIYGDLNYQFINLAETVCAQIQMGEDIKSTEVQTKKMEDAINKANSLTLLAYYMWLLVMMIMQLAITLLVRWVTYSRLLKMYLYATFSPIGMSDIISGGFNSKGFKYLKGYLALGLQGVIILVVVYAQDMLLGVINKGKISAEFTITFLASYLIGQLVVAAAIQRSEAMAKEVIGA